MSTAKLKSQLKYKKESLKYIKLLDKPVLKIKQQLRQVKKVRRDFISGKIK